MERSYVQPWAEVLVKRLSPGCEKIEIAGSLRREKPDVKDIELVALPHAARDLYGDPSDGATLLDNLIERYVEGGMLAWDTKVKRNGSRYKRLISTALEIPVDLFLADADNWGYILALRTGCADFSHALVTRRDQGGLMFHDVFHRDGYLWGVKTSTKPEMLLPCPDEQTYFRYLGLSCIPPSQRTAESVAEMREFIRRAVSIDQSIIDQSITKRAA